VTSNSLTNSRWPPSQAPLVKARKIDIAANNLSDARIGFAISKAAYDAGLKTYADIARFKDSSTASSMASNPAAALTAPSRR
jgi:ABC-type proline/glycine betaine transport system substrate-binding protein